MERKSFGGHAIQSPMTTQSQTTSSSSLFSCCVEMKRCALEFDLQELVKKNYIGVGVSDFENDNDDKGGGFRTQRDKVFPDIDEYLSDICTGDFSFDFKNREMTLNGFTSNSGVTETTVVFSKTLTPMNSSISVTMDSQSSICVGSPISANNPTSINNQARGATSGSSREQSDDEEAELEAGPCEQSNNGNLDIKRIRRMFSNRESARRSRKRKQAHLQDLELQADKLIGDNATLFKQFTDATQQLRNADTNNRVLKSNVEAMRAKVKLAEDMVTRGSLTCNSLIQLFQNHPSSPPQQINPPPNRTAHVSPTITVPGDDASISVQNNAALRSLLNNGNTSTHINNTSLMSGGVSCVSDIWQ